jgi:uncharacterized ferritin-like protein (DUF455 family)
MTTTTLSNAAAAVLTETDPAQKAQKMLRYRQDWQKNRILKIGNTLPPDRPGRPEKPELLPPRDMPRRRKSGSDENKAALLHALAHIELNAIDLACDILARFAPLAAENAAAGDFSLPKDFFDDWCRVAADEARHFLLLCDRLAAFGKTYGDFPAHDGLWQSAEMTAHDFAARLAIVPMVLEARGLDVTPAMISAMQKQGDTETAEILQTIYQDEITHVAAGTRWFGYYCDFHRLDAEEKWQNLVRQYFHGFLKPPFNDPARENAGLPQDWYAPLAEDITAK